MGDEGRARASIGRVLGHHVIHTIPTFLQASLSLSLSLSLCLPAAEVGSDNVGEGGEGGDHPGRTGNFLFFDICFGVMLCYVCMYVCATSWLE